MDNERAINDWRRCRRDFEAYLRREKGMADNSVRSYRFGFGHLMNFMAGRAVEPVAVDLGSLQQLLAELNAAGIAPTTQRRIVSRVAHVLPDDGRRGCHQGQSRHAARPPRASATPP